MFSFKLDKSKLDSISKLFGTYLDIVFTNNTVLVASEGGMSYMHLSCPAVSETGDTYNGFRVESKLFLSVAMTGKVLVEFYDTEVGLSFYGETQEVVYKIFVPNQRSFIDFNRILRLLNKVGSEKPYSLVGETRLARLASKFKTPIICMDGYMFIYYKNSYAFCKSELPSFSCDSVMFKNAIDVFNHFYLIEDSILVSHDDIVICIDRIRLPISTDIGMLISGKARGHYTLDFRKLVTLMNKVNSENYDIRLNFSVSKCFISCDKGKFEVSVPDLSAPKNNATIDDMISKLSVSKVNLNSSPMKVGEKIIRLPYWIFALLDNATKVELYVKRACTLIIFNNICLVVGGSYIV